MSTLSHHKSSGKQGYSLWHAPVSVEAKLPSCEHES